MNGTVEIVDDVALAFAERVRDEVAKRETDLFSIALSGGSTATPCYRQLAKQSIDWSRVVAIFGDERCVPLDHEDSNCLQATRALFDNVSPLQGVYPMDCTSGAEHYEEVVRRYSPIDLVHLGMGDDGHTASLFPDSPVLKEAARLVVETGDEQHRHRRMTLTYKAINQSRLVVFTVAGEKKREMFARIRKGEDFPATHVNAPRVIWLVDRAAMG